VPLDPVTVIQERLSALQAAELLVFDSDDAHQRVTERLLSLASSDSSGADVSAEDYAHILSARLMTWLASRDVQLQFAPAGPQRMSFKLGASEEWSPPRPVLESCILAVAAIT